MQPFSSVDTGSSERAQDPSQKRWELYRVLAEPVRLKLLALAGEEELAVGELAELLGESQPNISRHAAPLRALNLLSVRREGTRTLLSLAESASLDPVVLDALASGRGLCEADGSLARVADVVRARDAMAREFFAKPGKTLVSTFPAELGAYLTAFGNLIPDRGLAIDAGTGDGGLLDILAPIYKRVIAIDRSDVQIQRARERVVTRGYDNVELVVGEPDRTTLKGLLNAGADAVFASRLLHHAPRPAAFVQELARLCRPGGALVIIDYLRHDDETMRDQADVWLGFDTQELKKFAKSAGLEQPTVVKIPSVRTGSGPDHHLQWQVLIARNVNEDRPAKESLAGVRTRKKKGA